MLSRSCAATSLRDTMTMYPVNRTRAMRKNPPSSRSSRPSRTRRTNTALARNMKGHSNLTSEPVTGRGNSNAARPSTNATFMMFDPTTFPTAMSGRPSSAAIRLTTISGSEVPRATTVSPTTAGVMPARRERVTAPRTSSSPPPPNRSSPKAVRPIAGRSPIGQRTRWRRSWRPSTQCGRPSASRRKSSSSAIRTRCPPHSATGLVTCSSLENQVLAMTR